MIPRIAIAAILLGAAAVSSWAVASHFLNDAQDSKLSNSEFEPECLTQLNQFRQSVVWQRHGKKLMLNANTACGDRLGHVYELTQVTLTLMSGERILSQVTGPSGTLALNRNRILIGQFLENNEHPCLGHSDSLLIDLNAEEIRTPGHRILLSDDESQICKTR
jgi:hypothetical protein